MTIQIAREETRCRHMGYSFWIAARVLLYAPSHRQNSTCHGLYCTSRGTLAGTRNSSIGGMKDRSVDLSHYERTLLPRSYISLPLTYKVCGQLRNLKIMYVGWKLNKYYLSFFLPIWVFTDMLLNSLNNILYRHMGNLGISQKTYIKHINAPV